MSGHRPFDELTQDFSPERRQRVAALKSEMLEDMRATEVVRGKEITPGRRTEMTEVRVTAADAKKVKP